MEAHGGLSRQVSRIDLQEGELYSLHYDQRKELGRGKFGVVYHVKDKQTDRCYAAKHIRIRKPEQKEKVVEEINLLKKFSNPHIIRFIEAFESPGEVILIMEYLDGGELFERVAGEDFNLTESDCCQFMKQICRGVSYLHDHNIVHLDLKPENVVCTQRDNTQVKIIDFGTAKQLGPGEKVKVLCGTPEFVAPEVVNYDFISTGSDMWALGVICYILLSGFSPFMGDNDAETYINISSVTFDYDCEEFDEISENAKDFINSLLKKDPGSRMKAEMCLEHVWLREVVDKLSDTVIRTENLRRFLARRRWQRCGQAIRAMSRMTGMMRRSRESSPRTVRDGSESPSGGLHSSGLSFTSGLSSNGLNFTGLNSAGLHLSGPTQDSTTRGVKLVSISPLASPNSTRRAEKMDGTPAGGTSKLTVTTSPLASPSTARRIDKMADVSPEEGVGVRARLNLLEERMRGEAERERRGEKLGLDSGGRGGR